MVHAGHLSEAYGYSNQGYHVYLAAGLRRGKTALDHEEQDLISQVFPLQEVERMIRDGEIKDATTAAAFGLLRLKALL
jgi:ADP-ribose pyrophosphatase